MPLQPAVTDPGPQPAEAAAATGVLARVVVSAVRGVAFAALAAVACAGCGKKGPELTCKANDVCFVCPDEKQQARCHADPSTARCKWAPPDHCSAASR